MKDSDVTATDAAEDAARDATVDTAEDTAGAGRRLRREKVVRRDFAFVHINKCGGRSVEHALGLPKFHGDAMRLRALHGEARWQGIYSFSVVRNPFTRMVSLYRYRVRAGRLGDPAAPMPFPEWVVRVFRDADPQVRDGRNMFRPAFDWLHDADGAMIVRESFRLEELDRYWDLIRARVGRGDPLRRRNADPDPVLAASLYDAETRAIVADAFAADLETWAYRFPA